MANLEFCDTHNMVAYLQKTEGSEGFHQIVDFLNTSHIRYALTENPTIYVSLIQQFWNTATTRTLDNREIKITAIIDGKVKIVTEASIRRHLKLEDSDGISTLPTTEIFEQLALMGQETVFLIPISPTQTHVVDKSASTGVDVRHGGAATIVTSLDAGQGSSNINKTPSMPHDSPLPRVNILGSDEGRMQHNELMDLATKLSDRVVKKLEKTVKSSQARRKVKIVVSDDEDDLEDPFKQGRKIDEVDQDPDITLVQHDAEIQGRHEQEMEVAVTTASATISIASPPRVSTAEDISTAETLVYIRRSASKDKGKDIMTESEPEPTKTKLQQRQERLDYETAVRLQAELEEEERQRISKVHEEASSFNVKEWEDIQAKIEAAEELA
ncbi:hypothetical protein Tco_0536614 [Tanacetum coccineum]